MIEVLKQMVEALEVDAYVYNGEKSWAAIKAGKQAIAELESQEPVGWRVSYPDEPDLGFWLSEDIGGEGCLNEPLYTTPPQRTEPAQRTWVGLTDDEMFELWYRADEENDRMAFGKAVEAKLKEKNT
jgi:hypothetical protein